MGSGYDIIRIAADYPVGGKPSYGLQPNFYYLSKEQEKQGNRVRIIARRGRSQPSLEYDGGIEIHRVENPFNLNAYRTLRKLLPEASTPLIHTHSTSGLLLSFMKRPLGLPLFAHVHGASRSRRMPQKLSGVADKNLSSSKLWYSYFRERLIWSSADRVLAVSKTLKEDLISRYSIPGKKISVVYNGVDTTLFRRVPLGTELPAALKKFEGKKIVLYVGHFGRKGLIFLIKAMKEIVSEVPDAVAVCIGGLPEWLQRENYRSFLEDSIRKIGLEDRILLLDRVPNDELPAYYSAASVFVLPSFYEAFAKVVLEAMACEDPVIVTREGGPQEAIDEGKSGLLVKYGSIRELDSAVIAVLEDEGKARQMGVDARKRIERDFTWKAVASRVSAAYGEVME